MNDVIIRPMTSGDAKHEMITILAMESSDLLHISTGLRQICSCGSSNSVHFADWCSRITQSNYYHGMSLVVESAYGKQSEFSDIIGYLVVENVNYPTNTYFKTCPDCDIITLHKKSRNKLPALFKTTKTAYVHFIFIRTLYRGMGLGKKLIMELIDKLKSNGYEFIVTVVYCPILKHILTNHLGFNVIQDTSCDEIGANDAKLVMYTCSRRIV